MRLFIYRRTGGDFDADTGYYKGFTIIRQVADKKGKTLIYAGYVASMEHTDIEEEILSAEVKRFQAVPEIRHKEWQKRGPMKPLQPEETPEYNFSDLQMSIYHTITI